MLPPMGSHVAVVLKEGNEADSEKIDVSILGVDPGSFLEPKILLVISAFVIGVFFYVLTLQKANQFGVMKAIGANNRFLAKAIVSQITLLASVSIGIGVLLTYGTTAIFPSGMPFALDPMLVLTYAVVLLVVSVFSSLISVRKITKIDPLQAIGRVE